jgi:hypothetical protein
MNGYLKKLSGEAFESKGTACMGLVRAPFSKVTRATFGLHMRGGRLGEIGVHKK